MYQSFKPLDLFSRYSPELFVSLKDLSVGLILRIAVSVNAIGGGSIFSMNREAPINLPKAMHIKKPDSPSQDNRAKIISYFLNVSGLAGMSRD